MKNKYEKRIYKRRNKKKIEIYPVPTFGSIIIINEKIYSQNPGCNSSHLYRGCVLVHDQTEHLLICKEQRTSSYECTITFKKIDFIKGMLQFKAVQKPMYTSETSWMEYALDRIH